MWETYVKDVVPICFYEDKCEQLKGSFMRTWSLNGVRWGYNGDNCGGNRKASLASLCSGYGGSIFGMWHLLRSCRFFEDDFNQQREGTSMDEGLYPRSGTHKETAGHDHGWPWIKLCQLEINFDAHRFMEIWNLHSQCPPCIDSTARAKQIVFSNMATGAWLFCLSFCLSARLSVCLSFFLSLSPSLSVSLF